MKKIKLSVPFTSELKALTLENETHKLKEIYKEKNQKLIQEFEAEVEKLKEIINSINMIDTDFEFVEPVKKKGWSNMDLNILKNNFGKKSIADIAKLVNKSYQTTIKKVNELGLRNDKSYVWNESEIDTLVNLHAQSKTDDDISVEMMIPIADVKAKITQLKDEGVRIMRGVNRKK